MTAYYNEHDLKAAAWLRELIKAGVIAPGVVDERSIEDVQPADLAGFTQCHFFAGVGVWSYALRAAGVSDSARVWTGSCPCQPFSAAGKGGGFADERHLWPAWFHLITQCRPSRVYGEQVASKDGLAWVDLVQADMEGANYTFRPVDLCAAGVGAPHIRQRLWFVADTQLHDGAGRASGAHADGALEPHRRGNAVELVDAEREGLALGLGLPGIPGGPAGTDAGQAAERAGVRDDGLGDTASSGWRRHEGQLGGVRPEGRLQVGEGGPAGPTNGHWRSVDWLLCRDGKWRPVEPGTFPLAHGAAARVGRLRGFGNAIVAQVATEFIKASL